MDEPQAAQDKRARFPFDAIYKALCCHRDTVADVLRSYVAKPEGPLDRALIDALDLRTLRKISMEWVTRGFRVRRGDQVWQVAFKPRAQARGYPPLMFVNLEFQSRSDGVMALRFLDQGNELYRELRAQGAIAEGDPCPVLCVLLHNGRTRWKAASSTAELVNAPPVFGRATVPAGLAAFHPWGYWPASRQRRAWIFVAHSARPHVPGSIVSMMIGIEFAEARPDFVAPLWETARNLGDEQLRDTVARWLKRLNESYNLDLPGMEELLKMQDVTVLTSRLDETIEGWHRDAVAKGYAQGDAGGYARGRAEGISRGRAEGIARERAEGIARERALLRRLAAQRFGGETAERVDALLEGVADWDLLGSVGEWIVDAQSGDQLADRVADLVRRQT